MHPIVNQIISEKNMSATMLNGKLPRKQLADQLSRLDDQLDRHDSILDALAEGLDEAVRDSARVGVRQAVKDAVVELLTNPDLRQILHQASSTPAKPNFWQRCKAKWHSMKSKAIGTLANAKSNLSGKATTLTATATKLVGPTWRLRKPLTIALGVGFAMTVVSSVMSHHVAATLSGIGAAAATLSVQIMFWIRQAVKRFACL